MTSSLKSAAFAAVVSMVLLPGVASAEMGVGIGMSWVFGSAGSPGGLAAGAKLIGDREDGDINPAIGLDYIFADQALRPNIGAVYQKDGLYGDASFGYNLGSGAIDFSLGGGLSNSEKTSTRRTPAVK